MSLFLDYFSYAFYHGLNFQNVSPFACAQSCASSLPFWEWCSKTFVQELWTPLVLQKQLDLCEINIMQLVQAEWKNDLNFCLQSFCLIFLVDYIQCADVVLQQI